MATKIGTISNALLLIGDDTINSLDEGTQRAKVAANLYDNIYEVELNSHPWAFARKLQQMNQTTETPIVSKWRYIYQIPTDCIAIYTFDTKSDYEIYGDKVYSNQPELILDYSSKVSEASWPGYFAKLMEHALAKDFCIPLREDAQMAQVMYQQYINQGQRARAVDSKQKIQRPIQSQPFLEARWAGR